MSNFRLERIEKLLKELEYEVTRGMLQGEIQDETIYFRFHVPISKIIKNGTVLCEFRTRPLLFGSFNITEPKLKLVKGKKSS